MDSPKTRSPVKQQRQNERLGKKLAYVLRYGAEKEGLSIDSDGFVDLDELLPLFYGYMREDLVNEITTSVSSLRNVKRYETKEIDGHILVKATYGHRMIRNPCHDGTSVPRLFTLSIDALCSSVNDYDFQDFPDGYLLGLLMRRLKEKSLLTNKTIRALLVPSLTHLDLFFTYVNESTLKLIPKQCKNLVWLSFNSCGYIITDHLLPTILKGLSKLESLNFTGCHHLTEKSFSTITKNCPNLKHLNLTHMKTPSPSALFELISKLKHLEELNIYNLKGMSTDDYDTILAITEERKFFRLETADLSSQAGSNGQIFDSVWERPNFR